MLVKFTDDSPEFERRVEVLKKTLGVGAASKVALYCVNNYTALDSKYEALTENFVELREELDSLKSLIRDRERLDLQINRICEESL